MEIKRVSLIGLGALGVMYAHHMSKNMDGELRIIANQERINRYNQEGIYCNDELCTFNYVTPETEVVPADLLIFSVKYTQLKTAIKNVAKHIGPDTIIISVLNGVVSEKDIGAVYGEEKNIYAVSQGMDAVKTGNKMFFKNMGIICFGELNEADDSTKVKTVRDFFSKISLPYEVNNKMGVKLWSKLMLNVGINQTVSFYRGTTNIVQKNGPAKDMMVKAMRETIKVAQAEGINLTETDLDYWIKVINGLNPSFIPSMAQDVNAKRYSEFELFSGTIVTLAEKHGLKVPINQKFYNWITQLESKYNR